jgi:uncharacterized protein (TIGR02757 family)
MKLSQELVDLLNSYAVKYNQIQFIADDPISIPHQFSKKQDIEIAGFITAMISWGNRKTIINSANGIFEKMDNSPYDFIMNHKEIELKRLENCKHRTFQYTDLLYFIALLKYHYNLKPSLEDAFLVPPSTNTREGLINFHNYFFSLPFAPQRTKKHVSTPQKNSACKRLNMFLRWMVRKDNKGVDFGIWNQLKMKNLILPLDVHVINTVEELFGINKVKPTWAAAEEITNIVKVLKPEDPTYYDFALFGYGIDKKRR